jgi:hypothetical protein
MFEGTNTTGWAQLYNGNLIQAAFLVFDTALMGWTVAILFVLYQFMLLMKTRSLILSFVMGLIFVGLFATASFVKVISRQIMVLMLIFELAGILYFIIWK